MDLQYWNRKANRKENEKVYGDILVKLLYGNPLGFFLADSFLAKRGLSALVGKIQDSPRSASKVPAFIQNFHIPMDEYEPGPFRSFNHFFIRKFKDGKRPFPTGANEMGAFAEARYLAFADVSKTGSVPIKGLDLNPMELLGHYPDRDQFKNGPCLLARLCPVDYHRFHFPDDGNIIYSQRETGKLHSVNPMALHKKNNLFLSNERQVSILKTAHFGMIAYIEVGALCVGKIVQTHGTEFKRGSEKGYFLFGASTVIVLGQKGAWEPKADLLHNTAAGLETLVCLGDSVAITPVTS